MALDEREALLRSSPGPADPALQKVHRRRWVREVVSLLKWSMLAACTVGPGTVVVCAKAGADFKLELLWTVLVAAFVAFVLQKEAARLTMVSGMSLGAAIRRHFGRTSAPTNLSAKHAKILAANADQCQAEKVPVAGYACVLGVFVGNTAYEANCFVGAMAALYVLYTNVAWFRIVMAVVTGVATLAALLWGNVDQIGAALGVIVIGMTFVFAVTAGYVDVSPKDFGLGLVPSFPQGSSVTVLSLMATTCIPFNVFLAASLCGDATGGEMRRGIAFASVITAIISVLVIVIGSNIDVDPGADFAVEDLGNQIGDGLGFEAKVLFCVGLYAAAYSSAITCPLGAALTAEQIMFEDRSTLWKDEGEERRADNGALEVPVSLSIVLLRPVSRTWLRWWQTGGLLFRGSLLISVGVAVAVAAANLDTVSVILFAQVINGLLLPFFAICLYLCLNDIAIMPKEPRARDSALMLFCVGVTIFLAAHLVCEQISIFAGGGVETEDVNENGEGAWSTDVNVYVAIGVAVVGTAALAVRKRLVSVSGSRRLDG